MILGSATTAGAATVRKISESRPYAGSIIAGLAMAAISDHAMAFLQS